MKGGRTIKCMMVGDTGVGKTCAVEMFTRKNVLSKILPTANLMKYQAEMSVDGEKVSLEIWDTPGEDSYASIRKSCYPLTDVVLLVFSMVNRQSLDNVKMKLFLEVKDETKNMPLARNIPIVLAGMQKDKVIVEKFPEPLDGINLSMKSYIEKVKTDIIKPDSYHECSTNEYQTFKELFQNVARSGIKYQLSNYKLGLPRCMSIASQACMMATQSLESSPSLD